MRDFRDGFTLAEVLITLGIIGCVAALTIPSLVANYRMKTYETAFKKTYSVIQNTINYVAVENSIYDCYAYYKDGYYTGVGADCTALKNELFSSLKLTKLTDYSQEYASITEVMSGGGVSTNPTCSYYTNNLDAYLMSDGAVILTQAPESSNQNSYNGKFIIIDINGVKKPNKWGYDVFWMTLSAGKSKNIRLTDEYCSLAEKGGLLPRAILKNEKDNKNTHSIW